MKVIILAGGWGSRLGNITELLPKPMVRIGNHPILWHIMKIYSYFGFNDFIICLGVKADIIKDYFYHFNEKNSDFTIDLSNNKLEFHNKNDEKWRVTLVFTGLNTLKGGRIKRVENFLDSDTTMLTYGDGLADVDINMLLEFHRSHGKLFTITGVHSPSRFGEIFEKEGKILSFKEKPESFHLINGGFMIFNNDFLDYLTTDENCDLEVDIFDELAVKGEIMVYKHDGEWDCMDHERDVAYLNRLWNSNNAFWKIWQ